MSNKKKTNKQQLQLPRGYNLYNLMILIIFSSLLIFLVMLVISGFFYQRRYKIETAQFKSREQEKLDILAESIGERLDTVRSDLEVVYAYQEFHDYLQSDEEKDKNAYAQELLDFSQSKKIYDQIRYLDKTGQEIIRVNYRAGLAYLTSEDQLQNKADRYYFIEAMALDQNEIYISHLDLNVEKGQVKRPVKPVLRVAMPVFGEGEKKGIIVLNYLAQSILKELDSTLREEGEEIYLIDQDGYWLKGPNRQIEWGFMYEDRKDETLQNWNSPLWEQITPNHNYQAVFSQGLFTSTTIYPNLEIQKSENGPETVTLFQEIDPDQHFWKIISFLPKEIFLGESSLLLQMLIGTLIAIFIILLITAFLALINIRRRVKSEKMIVSLNNTLRIITKVLRHDLANMFTHINVALELFRENPKNKTVLDEIEKSANQGIRIINKMRQLEGLVASGKELETINIRNVLNKLIKNYKIKINIIGQGNILADEAIEAVFANIISNAIRHGKTKKIDIKINKLGKKIQIKFIDYGTGVPDKIKKYVFEEGFKYGAAANTGLGLYIAEQIINRYGGKIWVEDNKLQGAIFIIEI